MKHLFILGALVALLPLAQAQTHATNFTNQTDKVETKADRDARMAWWRDARFGLFIHWGVYSVPAGYYHDQPVAGIGEWIMYKAKIPVAEYQQFAKDFNPTNFNADEWVKMARDAGMKYIVITSKHHDGFAMFCSQASRWNICDASPFARDPLKELAAACRKYGIKLGFYYSQAQDWCNGGAVGAAHLGANAPPRWDQAQAHDMDDYIDRIAAPQVREILSRYGPDVPAVLWWDTPRDMNQERAEKLYRITQELRPELIQNNRLGGGFNGDTETPEQFIPPQGYPGRDWETCMTMNNTWGFKRDDHNWKSTETLIHNLCDIASKGGNYLLNVGPTSEGLIPPPSVERLAEVGRWMRTNGEAIHGTGPTAFGAEAGQFSQTETNRNGTPKFIAAWNWRCTTKPGKIYLHIFKWPDDGTFALPAVKDKINDAYLLADPKRRKLKFKQTDQGVNLALPDKAPDAIASVVCLETR